MSNLVGAVARRRLPGGVSTRRTEASAHSLRWQSVVGRSRQDRSTVRNCVTDQPSTFDAAKYKHAQREQWNKDGEAWRRWSPTLNRWYGEASRQMLELARIGPGQRVL